MTESQISPSWATAGLYDAAAADAQERRDLIVVLEELGFTPDQFAALTLSDNLGAAASRIANRPGKRMRAPEAAQLAGVPKDLFDEATQAAGYPADDTELMFTQGDVEAFRIFGVAEEVFSREEILHFTSVLGSATSRIAEAAATLFRMDVVTEIEAAGATEADFARANHDAAQLLKTVNAPMWSIFLAQMELATKRADVARLAAGVGTPQSMVRMGVGFVDLVGYTPLTAGLNADELSRFMREFEAQAYRVVSEHNGRVVKLIGDEVMFVSVDANDAVAAAAALQTAFGGNGVIPRAGVTYGNLVTRGGDYYGLVVNMAARIADIAIPGELLVDDETVTAASQHVFEPAGRRQLKGFAEPQKLSALIQH